MAEYIRGMHTFTVEHPRDLVVNRGVLEEILGRALAPWEPRTWERYGYRLRLGESCTCPALTGVLAKVVCKNGHPLD